MMHRVLLILALLVGSAVAMGPRHSCDDPETNAQWQSALERYPDDHLVTRLATQRETLCKLLKNGEISVDKAQAMWEHSLTQGLLERARAEERKRGLLPLFSTF